MTERRNDNELDALGLGADITRRDFINTGLIGSGAALLTMQAPGLLRTASAQATLPDVGEDWTGYGGVGDYARPTVTPQRSSMPPTVFVTAAINPRSGTLKTAVRHSIW